MKRAFVLSGGGAKGAFQFGVMKQLLEAGIKPDAIYGTSVGALNGLGYIKMGIQGLENLWRSVEKKSDVVIIRWLYWIFTLGLAPKGFYSTAPLRGILEKYCSGKDVIECPVTVTKVSLKTGELAYAKSSDSDFLESVLSSASVPVIMEPNGEWVDGGVREQTPIAKALADGFEKVIVILNNPISVNPEVWEMPWYFRWFQVLKRIADDVQHQEVYVDDLRILQHTNADVTVYAPDKLLLGTMDYYPEKISPAIAQGYAAKPIVLDSF